VQDAAARLICRLRRFDHVTDALVSLHWLRVPERVVYKIAVQGSAWDRTGVSRTCTFVSPICLVDMQSLRSAGTNRLVVSSFKLSTIGTRAFPVASPHVWNSLPAEINYVGTVAVDLPPTNKKLIFSVNHLINSTFNIGLCTLSVDLAVTFT